MDLLLSILPYIQMVLAVILIGAILMQQRGAGLGGAFGGSNDGTVHYERRGFEKTLFKATIALAVAFVFFAALPIFLDTNNQSTTDITSNNASIDAENSTSTPLLDGSSIQIETAPVEESPVTEGVE